MRVLRVGAGSGTLSSVHRQRGPMRERDSGRGRDSSGPPKISRREEAAEASALNARLHGSPVVPGAAEWVLDVQRAVGNAATAALINGHSSPTYNGSSAETPSIADVGEATESGPPQGLGDHAGNGDASARDPADPAYDSGELSVQR